MWNQWTRGAHPWSSLWDEVSRLQHEVSRHLPAAARGRDFPAINLWIDHDGAVMTAELPGLKREDIDLSVNGKVVTLKGERKSGAPENAEYQRRECARGVFSRTFDMPFTVDAAQVDAQLADGVLRVKLPRAESDKPRKIAIGNG